MFPKITLFFMQAAEEDPAAMAKDKVGEILSHMKDRLLTTLVEMGNGALDMLPKLVVGFVIFLIGLIICKIVRRVVTMVLDKVGFDKMAASMGLKPMLVRAGVKTHISTLIGKLLFWILLIQFIQAGVKLTELQMIIDPVEGIINFLPKVITASLILLIGYIVADLLRNMVSRWGQALGLDYIATLSSLFFGFLMVLFLTISVKTLGVDTELIEDTVRVFEYSIGAAIALSLGLGLRPVAHNVVCGVYARRLYKSGTVLEIEGGEATVVSVGPVATRLAKGDNGFVIVPNSQLFDDKVFGKGGVPEGEED